MSTVILGDIHGSTFWKTAVAENPNCQYIFLGDYLDGKDDMDFNAEIANLQEIINFKTDNPDNVILLLGNHDLMYIEYEEPLFVDNLPLFQNAYQIDNIVFTHAGIVHKWFVEDFGGSVNRNIVAQLNNPANRRQRNALRQVGDKYTVFTCIHGITKADTKDSPLFPDIWAKIAPKIAVLPLVVHNAPFDEGCLKAVHRSYGMDYLDYEFHCTCHASRRGLAGTCPTTNFPLFQRIAGTVWTTTTTLWQMQRQQR